MAYIDGTKEAVELLNELEVDGNLIRLNSHIWVTSQCGIDTQEDPANGRYNELLLVHLAPSKKSISKKFARIYPLLSPAIESKRVIFIILNLKLKRMLCIGVEGAISFIFDPLLNEFYSDLNKVNDIKLFLKSDDLYKIQELFDGVSHYVHHLREYKSIFRFTEDEVFNALEGTVDQSYSSLVKIEGDLISRGELLAYDEAIGKNASLMNAASRKIDFFFPEIDMSEFNVDESY